MRTWRARVPKFLRRHKWSLPLALLSFGFFVRLAFEVREKELDGFDRTVATWVQAERGTWDGTMLTLTQAGGQHGMTVVCVSAVVLLFVMKQRKASAFAATCGAGALLLTVFLKLLFHRARPEASVIYVIESPSSFSFPSGHALGSTSVLGCLVVLALVLRVSRPWCVVVAVSVSALILGVATSRVYFGVHYASDVLGGILAGAAWVATVTGWFYPRLLPGEASTIPVGELSNAK